MGKKVLYIIANLRVSNGVTSVIMNQYEKLIHSGYIIDFCAMYSWGSPHIKTILSNGGHYYVLPQINGFRNIVDTDESHERLGMPDKKAAYNYYKEIMDAGNYDIVHVHILGRYAYLALKAAKKCNVRVRIFHSHNPKQRYNLKASLYSYVFDNACVLYANKYAACSSIAGETMFGKRAYQIIHNTIDTSSYRYDNSVRDKIRKDLKIDPGAFVIGTVCRQTYQKNPFFILDIFKEILYRDPNAILLWIGTGELEKETKDYSINCGINNSVIFLGNRSDVQSMYSAMDAFYLPSLFEGLGIVFIEAQAAGVRVFASNVVPRDTNVTDLIQYLPLSKEAGFWASEIVKTKGIEVDRKHYSEIVKQSDFDKNNNTDIIRFYAELTEE